ncbi:MAG: cob(I)yrinic acid a,c-diamide adenosyltransferase [Schwartzia sp.]|nr:cob(I)yrinic acid a,c-diamide adenosyltransferase [Schwartzia sp. (in: firmicutes)]
MIQVYTGTGKGKTTAAIGLAMRAVGADFRVYMMQFMKGLAYSEQKIIRGFAPRIKLATTGKPFFVAEEGMLTDDEKKAWGDDVVIFPKGSPPADYKRMIEDGFDEAAREIITGEYRLAILDEINVALFFGLIDRGRVERLMNEMPDEVELVMTGRNAPDWLMERADLVTDMREVKHYYAKGVEARRGIEN